MTADDLSAHFPANAVRWLRPVCVLAYATGVVAVVVGVVLDSMLVSVIAIILLLVGLCSMAACCIATGSRSPTPPTTPSAAGMKGTPRAWLFEDDAREELDRAIAECVRDHGGSLHGEPTVMERTIVGKDGSTFAGTLVFAYDEDGWWEEYARVHGWPKYTTAGMRELKEEKKPEPSDPG